MKQLHQMFAEKVLEQYLGLEKSLRNFFSDNMDCDKCSIGKSCCSLKSRKYRFRALLSEWDEYVLGSTFPEWEQHVENPESKYCEMLSDTGCIIPEGRPNVCTIYLCNRYYAQIMPYEQQRDILDGFYNVGIIMSSLFKVNHDDNDFIDACDAVDAHLMDASIAISKNDNFALKYDYRSVKL